MFHIHQEINICSQITKFIPIIEVAEETFRDHLSETDQTKTRGDLRDIDKDGKISATDKVIPFGQFYNHKNKNQTRIFLLVSCFQENATVLKKILKTSLTKNMPKPAKLQQASNSVSKDAKSELFSKTKRNWEL